MSEPTLTPEEALHELFAEPQGDEALHQRVLALAAGPEFRLLTPVWGPPLYRRNRLLFRPFILRHFSWWRCGPWDGPYREALEQWLADADRLDDVELYRKLRRWKMHEDHRAVQLGRAELLRRFRAARTPARRSHVLHKYLVGFPLDDELAVELYETDPSASRDCLLRSAPPSAARPLMDRARWANDSDFYFALYRKHVGLGEWEKDVARLCDEVPDPGRLLAELERRHPDNRGLNLGGGFYTLARQRGREVFPYLLPNLHNAWRGWLQDWYGKLRDLALASGWLDLWAALVRTCGDHKEFDRSVRGVLDDDSLGDEERQHRLRLLASGRPGARPITLTSYAHSLSDGTLCALYRRYPRLLTGPFRPILDWACTPAHLSFVNEVFAAEDHFLIDILASRTLLITWLDSGTASLVARFSAYYERLPEDPAVFARRSVHVLGMVAGSGITTYDALIRSNRLARLLFERTVGTCLHEPALVRDLLESPCIHVQVLGLRTLALSGERARSAAADNLDLLLPCLLRPLHRRTRLCAFAALANAATVTEEHARRVVEKAREALDLPERHYPREELVGLIGRALARWPALAGECEKPVVYLWRAK